MGKVSLFFLVVVVACVLEQTSGWNYFWQANPLPQDYISYPYLSPVAPIWQQDCDKDKDSSDSSSSESSSSESSSSESKESKEGSSSSSESDSKESKESGENKESSSESSSSSESKGSKEENKEGSKEESEGGSKEESKGSKESDSSSESSEEKKKEVPKKKKKKEPKSLFPPRVYNFPPRQVQRIIYTPVSYMPYKSPYVVQQPAASYPAKSAYQYISIPTSSAVVKSYAASPVVGKLVPRPVQRIVYSPSSALNYGPAARVISGSWNNPISFIKK